MPVRQCLAWHIQPKLAHVKIVNDGLSIRARCPSCDSTNSLSLSGGRQLRVTFNCFAGCTQPDLRAALIKAGIPAACLPLSRHGNKVTTQIIAAIIQQGAKRDRAQTILRVYLISLGHIRWPRGAELVKLAAEADVSRAEAYRAVSAGPLVPSPVPPVLGG